MKNIYIKNIQFVYIEVPYQNIFTSIWFFVWKKSTKSILLPIVSLNKNYN